MNNKKSNNIEIRLFYFRLSRLLIGLKLWQVILISGLGGLSILGLGILSAYSAENDNFLIKGFIGSVEWIKRYSYDYTERFNILAFLYVTATIFFFIGNLFLLPLLLKKGLKITNGINQNYSGENGSEFQINVFSELKHLKHSAFFIFIIGAIFLLGEIVVIRNQLDQDGVEKWSTLFLVYLLVVPVVMNAIMVGTQSFLIYTIIRIINKVMPPLPAKLFDDDGYAGLAPAGNFICIASFFWLSAILLLTPLIYLSEMAGIGIFLTLSLIGFTLFAIPLYQLHKKLLDRKRSIMHKYSKMLNAIFEKYEDNPNSVEISHINMIRECYKSAEDLKVWVLFSIPTIGMQIISVIWSLMNKEIIKHFTEAMQSSLN